MEKTENFKVYEVEDNQVVSSEVIGSNGTGHGALAGLLSEQGVDVLICGGIGGGAQNRPWMQIVADIIGLPLYINEITVGASYGDALMAAIGSGRLGGFQNLEKIIKIREIIHPDPPDS